MSKIQTRHVRWGECEKESTWPPLRGTGGKGVFHRDRETGEFKEGPPPPREVYDTAPYYISDNMEPYKHPPTGKVVESKSELRKLDEMCGTITTDKKIDPIPHKQNELRRQRHEDLRNSFRKSIAQVDSGTAPLSEETRAKCAETNEIMSKALGFDAFNVAGRKNDRRGKRYRKR